MENKDILKMLKDAEERREKRKEYVKANIDKFRFPELEFVEDEDLPGMFWQVFAVPVDSDPFQKYEGEEHLPYIRLEWGWDAGRTEEELAKRAEDCPSGKEYIYMNLHSIRKLRDDLTTILDKYEK